MKMNELREAFAAWPKPADRALDNAATLIWMLKDVAPITEAGLRELGFSPDYQHTPVWVLGDIHAGFENGVCAICGQDVTALAKTMGRLRMLLLGVGECIESA